MTKPLISVYDGETDTTTVREMDDVEHAEHLAYVAKVSADRAAREILLAEKAAAKLEAIEKLTALGINPIAFGLEMPANE